MAETEPDKIWSPDNTNFFDWISHFGTMAQSVQDALEALRAEFAVPDTGWTDLTSYLNSAFTGAVEGRAVGKVTEIRGNINGATGSIASSGVTTDILDGLPEEFRPTGMTRFGPAWRSGYTGNVVTRQNGSMGIAQRSGTDWSGAQFSIIFLRD